MGKKDDKTNVMRVLDGKKIVYKSHAYEPDATMSGEEIAGILGEEPDKVFKTGASMKEATEKMDPTLSRDEINKKILEAQELIRKS